MTPSPHAQAAEMGYRRRPFLAPHRRRSLVFRLLKPFSVALLTVALPSALAAWVLFSPQFQLRRIEMRGLERVDQSWATAVLEPLRGGHILALPLSAVGSRLADHPWIDKVSVRKELPDQVVIVVEEKQPVAVLRRQDGLQYLAADGSTIGRFDLQVGPRDLPLVSADAAGPQAIQQALEAVEQLRRVAPAWVAGLSEVEILAQGDLRLFTSGLSFPILISGRQIESGVEALQANLSHILRRYPAVGAVDVRFPRQIVVQPAVDPRSREG